MIALDTRDDLEILPSDMPPIDEVIGSQIPTLFTAPKLGNQAVAEMALKFASFINYKLLPWQKTEVKYALDKHADGRWSAFQVVTIVPRQNGKNYGITLLELVHLFLLPDTKLLIHTAHQFKTARSAFRDLRDVILNTPMLANEVKSMRDSGQDTSIELHDGSRIEFIARKGGSGRGLSADFVVLDEAFNLDRETVADLLPTLAARPNPQIVFASSTGFEDSEVLADLHHVIEALATGEEIDASPRILGMEWITDIEKHDWRTAEACASSNPSLGYVLTWDFIRSTELAGMPEEQYKRERLGVWPRTSYDTIIPAHVWQQSELSDASQLDGDVVVAESLALEFTRDRDRAFLAIAQRTRTGRILVNIVKSDGGTAWVQDEIYNQIVTLGRRPVSGIVMDTAGAASTLAPFLESQGIACSFANGTGLAQASGLLFDQITTEPEPMLLHGFNPYLDDAAFTAGRRLMGSSKTAWTWSANADVPVEPLRAVTLALWGLVLNPALYEEKDPRRAPKR